MLFHNYPPIIILQGQKQRLELYTDRVVARNTSWLARRFPIIFGGAEMLYLDEITDVAVYPIRCTPDLRFKLVITGRHQAELSVDYLETEYVAANTLIDSIEYFIEQSEFLPPVG